MKFAAIILLVFVHSCTVNHTLKSIDLTYLFNDSSSKVWLIDKLTVGKSDFSADELKDKDVLVFFDSQACMFQPLKVLGSESESAKRGVFTVNSDQRLLTISFDDSTVWRYRIVSFSEQEITLIPLGDSDFQYELVLIPLPPF